MPLIIGNGVRLDGGIKIVSPPVPISTINNTAQSLNINNAAASFQPIIATGGTAPYTYFISSGTLPTGLTLNSSTGVVSGTPTALYGPNNITFSVKDANGQVSTINPTVTVTYTISNLALVVNYLVVAGGGGGGADRGGGGGAGGLRTGTITVAGGRVYTMTVGSGGSAGRAAPLTNSTAGTASSIAEPTLGSISSVGGGGGGSVNNFISGQPGGSGGGAGGQPNALNSSSPGAGTVGSGTPGQGFAGGLSSTNPADGTQVGLGGGGGGSGVGGAGSGPTRTGGAGGAGVLWPFTGSTYAGGGGGSFDNRGGVGVPGAGGAGGGGAGGAQNSAGTAGLANTGGGGGGGSGGAPAQNGAAGGSGVIILAMPNAGYTGIFSGATVSTPPAAPGMTVLTYTGSGTYTA